MPLIKEWSVDPQVKGRSIFDQLEDTDAAECLQKIVELSLNNTAFVFIKVRLIWLFSFAKCTNFILFSARSEYSSGPSARQEHPREQGETNFIQLLMVVQSNRNLSQ